MGCVRAARLNDSVALASAAQKGAICRPGACTIADRQNSKLLSTQQRGTVTAWERRGEILIMCTELWR